MKLPKIENFHQWTLIRLSDPPKKTSGHHDGFKHKVLLNYPEES